MDEIQVAYVKFEYEDELPSIGDDLFEDMLNCKKSHYVAMYPYIEIEIESVLKRFYLASKVPLC